MSLIIAILAGICPDWWPRRFPPRGGGGGGPHPDPWRFLGGIVGAVGGGLAWTALGPSYGNDSLSAAVIVGLLGGTAALWLLDAIVGGGAGRMPQP